MIPLHYIFQASTVLFSLLHLFNNFIYYLLGRYHAASETVSVVWGMFVGIFLPVPPQQHLQNIHVDICIIDFTCTFDT